MTETNNTTYPGVYVVESEDHPSVVGVATSVPAFIGYTEKAELNGKPCFNQAIKVGSMAEFETYFGGRYNPIYNYQNLQPLSLLQSILSWENHNLYYATNQPTYLAVQKMISSMVAPAVTTEDPNPDQNAAQMLTQNLANALPLMTEILQVIVQKNRVRPTSGAMAGVYAFVDTTRSVWNAPANIPLKAVDHTTYKLTNDEQGDLNVPLDGKAVNAIREFAGRGNVVWGARTLDGNSSDLRYIQVRRTMIYIEQSIKIALEAFVFAANDGNTWVSAVSMVSNFLQALWSQGGLMGAKASEAFSVQCGLGSTMTEQDLLEGYMIVQVTLAMIRPAEFIVLTFMQKMEG